MATSSSTNALALETVALKTALYDACLPFADHDPKYVFSQAMILGLGVIPNNDVNKLLAATQALVNERLFNPVTSTSLGWRLRSPEDARKYKSLRSEFEIVYSLIDEAGSEGIWTKTIKARSNLHDALFRQAIKHLESKHMITDMKSVEHPTRKMYIKSTLRPSERATGGPWYTDGELDTAFIQQMMDVCQGYILKKSFYSSKSISSPSKKREREPKKSRSKMTPEEIKTLRDKSLGPRVKTESSGRDRRKSDYDRMLPMPADYKEYPTCDELTEYIDASGISGTILTAADVQQLLDIMCFDEKIERVKRGVGEWAYRTLRKSLRDEEMKPQNLLTEAPCGRCPVFDLCEEGGPVGPSNCEYFDDWLSL